MSFHEKSSWACLVAILLAYIPYFSVVFSHPGDPLVLPAFVGAVCVLVAILIAANVVLALRSAKIRQTGDVPPPDEREVGIELQATKISAYFLGFVVIMWCLAAYVSIPFARVRQHDEVAAVIDVAKPAAGQLSLSNLLPIPAHDALFFVHLLFAGFVVANVVYYAALILGYRRSV